MRGKPGTKIVLTIVRKGETQPLVVTLTREEINVKSVRVEDARAGLRLRPHPQFQERTGEDLARRWTTSTSRAIEGPRARRAQRPGRPARTGGRGVGRVPAASALVVYTDGRTPDARMRLYATRENYLRGRGDD